MKYSPAGALRWRTTASFGGKHADELLGACLGSSGSIYAAGVARDETTDSRGVVVRIRR